jgi:hypothetical protein
MYKIKVMGRYSKITNRLTHKILTLFKNYHKIGRNDTWDMCSIKNGLLEFDVDISAAYGSDNYVVDGAADEGVNDDHTPTVFISFELPKNPDWQEVKCDLTDVIRHEIEHLTQSGKNLVEGKFIEDDQKLRWALANDLLPEHHYFLLPKEVDAMLQGLNARRAVAKRSLSVEVDSYLRKVLDDSKLRQIVKQVWNYRCKALSLPNII